MRSFFAWVGGKSLLRDSIVQRFPLEYKRYVEPFCGAAWVFFHKTPEKEKEVLNDFNSFLVNLYRCVRESPEHMLHHLRFSLNSREEFFRIKEVVDNAAPPTAPDFLLAAQYYQLLRYSYAAGLISYACQPHDIWKDFPLIVNAHERIRGIVLENQDFATLIKHYDSPDTFCYEDPPYYEAEGYYQNIGCFGHEDHVRLRDLNLSMNGRFLLSYNDHPVIRELYNAEGIHIEELSRLDNIRQRYEQGAMYQELLISNYDTRERMLYLPEQLTFTA